MKNEPVIQNYVTWEEIKDYFNVGMFLLLIAGLIVGAYFIGNYIGYDGDNPIHCHLGEYGFNNHTYYCSGDLILIPFDVNQNNKMN